MENPILRMMAEMADREGGRRGDDVGLTDLQVATRLRTFSELCYEREPTKFKTGDVVVHKIPEMATTKWANRPALFVRYLEKPYTALDHADGLEAISQHSAASPHDCVIAYLVDNGEKYGVAEFLGRSSHYRLYEEE